jgi:hypothetical protein
LLAVDWSPWVAPIVGLVAGLGGLALGHLLRIREWLREKRVNLYDEFLRAFRDAVRAEEHVSASEEARTTAKDGSSVPSEESTYERDLRARILQLRSEEKRQTEEQIEATTRALNANLRAQDAHENLITAHDRARLVQSDAMSVVTDEMHDYVHQLGEAAHGGALIEKRSSSLIATFLVVARLDLGRLHPLTPLRFRLHRAAERRRVRKGQR